MPYGTLSIRASLFIFCPCTILLILLSNIFNIQFDIYRSIYIYKVFFTKFQNRLKYHRNMINDMGIKIDTFLQSFSNATKVINALMLVKMKMNR